MSTIGLFGCQGQPKDPWRPEVSPLPLLPKLIQNYYLDNGELPSKVSDLLKDDAVASSAIDHKSRRYNWKILKHPRSDPENIFLARLLVEGEDTETRTRSDFECNIELGKRFQSWIVEEELTSQGSFRIVRTAFNVSVLIARSMIDIDHMAVKWLETQSSAVKASAFVNMFAFTINPFQRIREWPILNAISLSLGDDQKLTVKIDGWKGQFDLRRGLSSTPMWTKVAN